jgi:hypothetical protein
VGKFMNGPDEWDVIGMMSALAAVHHGRVELIMSPLGPGFGPSVMVTFQITFDVLPGSELPKVVGVQNAWPCKDHKSLIPHLYEGLYRLDAAVQAEYEQAPLPEAG